MKIDGFSAIAGRSFYDVKMALAESWVWVIADACVPEKGVTLQTSSESQTAYTHGGCKPFGFQSWSAMWPANCGQDNADFS